MGRRIAQQTMGRHVAQRTYYSHSEPRKYLLLLSIAACLAQQQIII
jgi:hypothetical protein